MKLRKKKSELQFIVILMNNVLKSRKVLGSHLKNLFKICSNYSKKFHYF